MAGERLSKVVLSGLLGIAVASCSNLADVQRIPSDKLPQNLSHLVVPDPTPTRRYYQVASLEREAILHREPNPTSTSTKVPATPTATQAPTSVPRSTENLSNVSIEGSGAPEAVLVSAESVLKIEFVSKSGNLPSPLVCSGYPISDGVIRTASHCGCVSVDSNHNITWLVPDGSPPPADYAIIATDIHGNRYDIHQTSTGNFHKYDVAEYASSSPIQVPPLSYGNSHELNRGDKVYSAGYQGIPIPSQRTVEEMFYIEHYGMGGGLIVGGYGTYDHGGPSGGPMLNSEGQVIGQNWELRTPRMMGADKYQQQLEMFEVQEQAYNLLHGVVIFD